MKLRTQIIISMAVFSIVLLIIAASAIFTDQQVGQLNSQQDIAGNIQSTASELTHISNDYFLFQENTQLTLWHSNYSSLVNNLSKLNPTNPEQQTILNRINDTVQKLSPVFSDAVTFLENAPRNQSVRILPEFQTTWGRLAEQNQALASDTAQLSQALRNQADQLRLENTLLIFALLAAFGAYFITVYLMIYRRTLRSIANLQAGTNVIGSGNLDYSIKTDSKDEVADLSNAFNQMTANLKTVTTSKTELEREITERKKAEQELLQAKKQLEAHIDNSPLAMIEFDSEFRVVRWSKEAEKMFGWSMDEILGKVIEQIRWVYEEDVEIVRQVSADMLSGKGPRNVSSNRNYRKDGSVIYCEWYSSAIYDSEGKLTSILSEVLDVTQRNQMQAKLEEYAENLGKMVEEKTKQLQEAERLATIGATAGMVGHDIRNPLQAITSDIYLAKTDLASMPKSEDKKNLQESLDEIEMNVSYINKIVSDLQDYARPLTPKLEETDLEQAVHFVLSNLDIPGNITVNHSIRKEFPKLKADQSYLRRILTNLANNAIQSMPNGGKLTINASSKIGKAIITIQDTGEGIPEDVRGKMFTPLVTTKSKGQGFGLAVVKRLTEGMGGTVTFESEVGKGTKFTLELKTA
jgi:PAS domain S-box-containing protein